jgi:hypothetical protein
MGRMKELAMWLSESIYIHQLSDDEIMTILASRYPDIQKDGLDIWLREQIKVVRENPNIYQSMFDIK